MKSSGIRIRKLKAALWNFVDIPGVEPTNNFAERTIRPYVLWRKISFGTQSERGNRFVERMMTVTATCRQQRRNVLEYLTAASRRTFVVIRFPLCFHKKFPPQSPAPPEPRDIGQGRPERSNSHATLGGIARQGPLPSLPHLNGYQEGRRLGRRR
jgi:hypothetical protein